jgi:hypothetical protein
VGPDTVTRCEEGVGLLKLSKDTCRQQVKGRWVIGPLAAPEWGFGCITTVNNKAGVHQVAWNLQTVTGRLMGWVGGWLGWLWSWISVIVQQKRGEARVKYWYGWEQQRQLDSTMSLQPPTSNVCYHVACTAAACTAVWRSKLRFLLR